MNRNKLTFQLQGLDIDYLSFNIDGIPDIQHIQKVAKYLFQTWSFNSTIQTGVKNAKKQQLFHDDENDFYINFVVYQRNTELNNFWDGLQIRFSGKNGARFYSLIKNKLVNCEFLKPHKTTKLRVSRMDVCYYRKNRSIDVKNQFTIFLDRCTQKIKEKSRIKHIECTQNTQGMILRIGSRSSPNYYRIYQTLHGVRFELEIKKKLIKSFQDFLFSDQIEILEHKIVKHFYSHSKKLLVFENPWTDWLMDFYRKQRKLDSSLLTTYFKQNSIKNFSLRNQKILFGLLQFLSFSANRPFKTIMFDEQEYCKISFLLRDFAKFLGEDEKYIKYDDRYRRKKYSEFFYNIQKSKPLITVFSDTKFRSVVTIPIIDIGKEDSHWIASISIAKQLYFYDYPICMPNSFITYTNTYQLQIRIQIIQSFSSEELKKSFDVQAFLANFTVSQTKKTYIKREIIKQLSDLPIEEEYELLLKNENTLVTKKLTTLLIGKVKYIYFYEIL